jgi:hypothetical protein
MFKIFLWILLTILIKSICQYILGAEETSIEKLFLGLDYPFYLGCNFGG